MAYTDVDALKGKVAELEELIGTLIGERTATDDLVSRLLRGERPTDLPEVVETRDQLWQCRSCKHRLGTYDPVEDVLRIRIKDVVIRIQVGPGSWVKFLCRDCLAENLLDYVPPEGAAQRLEVLGQLAAQLQVEPVDASEFLLSARR